jgi:hypothetical protein
MSETITLTDHDAIRDWVAARGGAPAMAGSSSGIDDQPVLRIVFEQQAYPDVDRPLDAGGLEVVEWDDWFRAFDDRRMALIVPNERPGKLTIDYQIVEG